MLMLSPDTLHANEAASAPPSEQALTSFVSVSTTTNESTAVVPSATDGVTSPPE